MGKGYAKGTFGSISVGVQEYCVVIHVRTMSCQALGLLTCKLFFKKSVGDLASNSGLPCGASMTLRSSIWTAHSRLGFLGDTSVSLTVILDATWKNTLNILFEPKHLVRYSCSEPMQSPTCGGLPSSETDEGKMLLFHLQKEVRFGQCLGLLLASRITPCT